MLSSAREPLSWLKVLKLHVLGVFLLLTLLCTSRGCGAQDVSVLVTLDDGGALEPKGECPGRDAVDSPCVQSEDCCSGLCGVDPAGKKTCRPATGCLGLGAACGFAGACCSLACAASTTADTASRSCASGPLCAPVDGACVVSNDCCSGSCAAGTCASPAGAACKAAGEFCAANGDCCGESCATASDGRTRCALLEGCRPSGEVCTSASDCCTGQCARGAGEDAGRCSPLVTCTANDGQACTAQVGEVCVGNAECCSRLCKPTAEGVKRCAASGGCGGQCETCSESTDCCSGSCAKDANGILRCAAAGGCGAPGERCTGPAQCCAPSKPAGAPPPPKGDGCTADPPGSEVRKCAAPAPAHCGKDGTACAIASDCCGSFCVPGKKGGLTCASACLPDGASCSTRNDCCGASSDCLRLAGTLVCATRIH